MFGCSVSYTKSRHIFIKSMSLSPDTDIPPPVPGLEWEVVGRGNPIQWMTEYVPLAPPGSRLVNQSVLFFELLRSSKQSRVTARLIVSTKQNMLLYETVRGERAFRFVKVSLIYAQAGRLNFQLFRNSIRLCQHEARHLYISMVI